MTIALVLIVSSILPAPLKAPDFVPVILFTPPVTSQPLSWLAFKKWFS